MGILLSENPQGPLQTPPRRALEGAAMLLSLMGWATVAMGYAAWGGPAWLALLGGIPAFLMTRRFWSTFVVEILALAFTLTVTPPRAMDWVLLGGGLSAMARLSVFISRRISSE